MEANKFIGGIEMTKEEIVELFLKTIDETKPELVEEYIEESFRI
ncbi:hypothetical protein [Bacillus sp. C30]